MSASLAAELRDLAKRDSKLAVSALAASARVLATKLDDPKTSASAAASTAKELREHLTVLRELGPPLTMATKVDDLRVRAARKLAG